MIRCERPSRSIAILVAIVALGLLLAACSLGPPQSAPSPPVAPPTAAVRQPGTGAHDVSLLVEPDDGLRPLTRAIRNATHAIWLTMYLLTNRTILHDLEYAHASGVDVRVILEPHPYGSAFNANSSTYDNLMAADIPVHWSSPRFALTHEKSMLIDNQTAYIMTTNFTRSAFRANREFDVVDRDVRDVRALHALFLADWTESDYVPDNADLPTSPTTARPLLAALLTTARHSLDLYAEELQDPAMEAELAAIARRGVHVRLILPAPSGPDRDAAGVATVSSAGVQVRRMAQASLYIHAKAIVVDGQRAFVGSENLSTASLDRNRELGVILADAQAIATLEATFDTDWAAA